MKVTIIDYTKMSIKEIEKYHKEQSQILLDMINSGSYSKSAIEFQKGAVDTAYKQLGIKMRKVSKMKG